MKKLLLLFSALLLINCDKEPPVTHSQDVFDIAFNVTGGFIGINHKLHIDANGYVTSIMDGDTCSGQLNPDELRQIQSLVQDVAKLNGDYSSNQCADVFYYEISLLNTRTEEVLFSATTDDCYLWQKPLVWQRAYLTTLIQELNEIMQENHESIG